MFLSSLSITRVTTSAGDTFDTNLSQEQVEYLAAHCGQTIRKFPQEKIPLIKFIREMTGAGLREAKYFVEDSISSTNRSNMI